MIIPPIAASFLLAQLHPHGSFAMTCAFIASFVALHAVTVGWLLAIDPVNLNAWINLLNVPFTCALMVSGGESWGRECRFIQRRPGSPGPEETLEPGDRSDYSYGFRE